ncbi:MAG: extracellular solute-binding protein [Chloroflexota bacterium]
MKRANLAVGMAVVAILAWACGGTSTSPSAESSAPAATGAASVAPPPAGATDLTFWTFVDRHATFFQQRAEAWNAANPDRPISITPSVIEYTQMHDNLTAALLSGTGAPDLVDIEIGKFAIYVKGELHLLDMTAEIEPYVGDLVETRLAPYEFDGKRLAADYHLGAFLMFYNKEILDAAGVNVDEIETWDDYIEAGKLVTKDGVTMAAVDVNGPMSVRGLMLQNGGGAYDAAGNLILNTPENVEAVQLVADMVNVHRIAAATPGGNNGTPEFYQAMADGQFASVWMPQWYMTRFPDNMAGLAGKMVVRPMPLFEAGGFTTTMGGGTGTAVTDQTPEAEQQLAKDFVTFAKLTKEGQTAIWTDLGFDPYRNDVYDDPSLQAVDEFFSGEVTFEIIKSELGNVAPEFTGPLYPEIQDYLNTTLIYDIVQNGVSAADALAAAQAAIASLQ